MPHEPSRFCAALRTLNQPRLDDLSHFLLPSGFGFGARRKWWGAQGRRRIPHEGVDLSWYQRTTGQSAQLAPGTRLPALAAGRIVRIIADFLGHTVFVAHEQVTFQQKILFAAYGHVEPLLGEGDPVREGVGLALIARPPASSAVPPHLHLSTLWLPTRFPVERLEWQSLTTSLFSAFCDPLPYLRGCCHQPIH